MWDNENMDNNCMKSFSTVSEYPCTKPACIRNKKPDCMATAVIPAITVETVDGLTRLANCFVHVVSNNTTYYIDDKHRPMFIWAGPVEVKEYNVVTNPLNLRSQFCLVSIDGAETMYYFDKSGAAHVVFSLEEE